jgi:hypothetical protein
VYDPSSGCAHAQAPSPKDFSLSFDACPLSLPPTPPTSDSGDKEEDFNLFDSPGALADTVPQELTKADPNTVASPYHD